MRPLVAKIDRSAIKFNLSVARQKAGAAKLAVAVKADAYGHGAVECLPALEAADILAVAAIEEALVLREAGARQPILLLEGVFEASEYKLCAEKDFQPVIHHQSQLDWLAETSLRTPISPWLKLDTGMARLGLPLASLEGARRQLQALSWVRKPWPLMSHLASADEPESPQTFEQWQRFQAAAASHQGPLSLVNSAGLQFHKHMVGDIARPGLMIYGAGPDPARHGAVLGLRPAMRLSTRIIALRQLQTGDQVGYGGTMVCKRPSLIATAAIGYGDGYPRQASGRAKVSVHGQLVPLAGRVSMDMIGMDVTDLPAVEIGDEVVLWGSEHPVETTAAVCGTIAYELLCGLTNRVKREYTDKIL